MESAKPQSIRRKEAQSGSTKLDFLPCAVSHLLFLRIKLMYSPGAVDTDMGRSGTAQLGLVSTPNLQELTSRISWISAASQPKTVRLGS